MSCRGRDIALRCPRPRTSGRNEGGRVPDCKRAIPSPDASLGDGDGAARRPYLNLVWKTTWATRPHFFSYVLNGLSAVGDVADEDIFFVNQFHRRLHRRRAFHDGQGHRVRADGREVQLIRVFCRL
jgi:hypothetical protein